MKDMFFTMKNMKGLKGGKTRLHYLHGEKMMRGRVLIWLQYSSAD